MNRILAIFKVLPTAPADTENYQKMIRCFALSSFLSTPQRDPHLCSSMQRTAVLPGDGGGGFVCDTGSTRGHYGDIQGAGMLDTRSRVFCQSMALNSPHIEVVYMVPIFPRRFKTPVRSHRSACVGHIWTTTGHRNVVGESKRVKGTCSCPFRCVDRDTVRCGTYESYRAGVDHDRQER